MAWFLLYVDLQWSLELNYERGMQMGKLETTTKRWARGRSSAAGIVDMRIEDIENYNSNL